MIESGVVSKRQFPCAFLCTVLSALVLAAFTLLGAGLASLLVTSVDGVLRIQRISPYTGCDLGVEYAVRAARLCLPVLVQLGICWLAAYVCFDRLLLCAVFAWRGTCFGLAMHLCLLLGAEFPLLLCAFLHAGISVLFLITVFHIRTETGILPLADSVTALLIAGGICSAAVILFSFLL